MLKWRIVVYNSWADTDPLQDGHPSLPAGQHCCRGIQYIQPFSYIIFINDYRKKSKQATVFDNTPNDFLIDNNQTSVSNEAVAKLNLKEVQEAIHSLPIIFKNPFLLYFDGYKYHEIADMLNEPLGTIKSRIHFARKLLKNQLHRY